MVWWEPVGVGVLGDLSHPHRPSAFQQDSEETPPMWKVPDLVCHLLIDSRIDESKQKAVLSDDPHCSVTSADDFPSEIGNALQQGIDV